MKMENKIKPLSLEQQIKVIKKTKKYLRKIPNYYACFSGGLCYRLRISLIDFGFYNFDYNIITLHIPLFTYDNANKYGGATNGFYWWNDGDKESRIKFLDWMLAELEKQLNTTENGK